MKDQSSNGKYSGEKYSGLTSQEAAKRLKEFGPNIVPVKRSDSYLKIFLSQFKNPLIYILLAAAAIIFFVESKQDALFISVILLVNAIVGTYQEGKAGDILYKLRSFLDKKCQVLRDGKELIIKNTDIVVGDIIILRQGDEVSSDCDLIEVNNLSVDESKMSGESDPVAKTVKDTLLSGTLLSGTLQSGTYVVGGFGKAIVTATGMASSIGRMKKMIVDTKVPLIGEIEKISYLVLWIITTNKRESPRSLVVG